MSFSATCSAPETTPPHRRHPEQVEGSAVAFPQQSPSTPQRALYQGASLLAPPAQPRNPEEVETLRPPNQAKTNPRGLHPPTATLGAMREPSSLTGEPNLCRLSTWLQNPLASLDRHSRYWGNSSFALPTHSLVLKFLGQRDLHRAHSIPSSLGWRKRDGWKVSGKRWCQLG